jgi:hypothetical protein
MEEARRLIVGGLEQEVVVGYFLPADELEDSAEVNEKGQWKFTYYSLLSRCILGVLPAALILLGVKVY